jgi:phage baseplate assembly protein W
MIDKYTGKVIDEQQHIEQSIQTILFTVIGTRIQRRTFGSYLFDLIDAPLSLRTQQLIMAVTADAIVRWEKRIKMTGTSIVINSDGSITVTTQTARYNVQSNHTLSQSVA